MTIDEHIGVIEDLKSTISVCLPEPEKTEICTSLSEAIDAMRKYQKIEQIYSDYLKYMNPNNLADRIGEVLEDGKTD